MIFIFLIFVNFINSKIQPLGHNNILDNFPNGIDYTLLNFGNIPYGISQVIFYIKKMGIIAIYLNCSEACSPFTNISSHTFEIDQQPIVLVEKGNCSTNQIARNIEKAGGKFALIIIDKNLDEVQLDQIESGDSEQLSISIPVLIISKTDGETLRKLLLENKMFSLKIDFLIQKYDIVKVRIMYSSDDLNLYKILKEFEKYEEKIGNY